MKKEPILFLIFILLLPVCSCNRLKHNKMPDVNVPLDDMNKDLHLTAPQQIGSFKMREMQGLVLENFSETPIILPQDYGVHIFQKTNGKWQLVENRFDYPPSEKEVYPEDGQPFREVSFFIYPMIFSEQPVDVRIVVEGNYFDEASGKKGKQVGAFIDLRLEP